MRVSDEKVTIKMTCSLFLTLPFLFFHLPKGVILPVERSAPSSAGLRSLTSQPGRDGPRSRAPVWIRERRTFLLPFAPVLCPSSPRSKRATSRRGTWTSRNKRGSSHWPERQQWPRATLPPRPVRLRRWRPVLCPAALLPPSPPRWGPRRISAQRPLKSQWSSRRN